MISPLDTYAQVDTTILPQNNAVHPGYLDIAIGAQYTTFRDFATSPLFYNSTPLYVALSHLTTTTQRESGVRISYAFGKFESPVGASNIVSTVHTFGINYMELFALKKINIPRFNLKVGGQLNATANIRDNKAFGNNRNGFEIISTLFGSVKGIFDTSGKYKKLKMDVGLGIHIGLLNTAYRNSYIYTQQSPILNQDHDSNGYEFQFFSGYRINSSLDYNFWFNNGNAIQLSYYWDMYSTGARYDKFQMASHTLKLSLLFNLK
ncbi:MAG: hypothetical protein AB8E82_07265 [Aureispira sp.]